MGSPKHPASDQSVSQNEHHDRRRCVATVTEENKLTGDWVMLRVRCERHLREGRIRHHQRLRYKPNRRMCLFQREQPPGMGHDMCIGLTRARSLRHDHTVAIGATASTDRSGVDHARAEKPVRGLRSHLGIGTVAIFFQCLDEEASSNNAYMFAVVNHAKSNKNFTQDLCGALRKTFRSFIFLNSASSALE